MRLHASPDHLTTALVRCQPLPSVTVNYSYGDSPCNLIYPRLQVPALRSAAADQIIYVKVCWLGLGLADLNPYPNPSPTPNPDPNPDY